MRLDPVTLEIFSNKVAAATEEMCFALQRTGRTLYVKETADFACALAGLDGTFFAYPRSIGVSGFVALDCKPAIDAVGKLEPGDVILTNDPYRSVGLATHLPDLHLIEPYFYDGRIVAFGWAFVHCSDVGGRVPSSISPVNQEIFQEGLQIPPVKLVRAGQMNEDVQLLFMANSRTPDANMGDIRAMLAALGTGRRRVQQLIEQHGVENFLAGQQDLVDYAAEKARKVLRRIPDGTYSFTDFLDDDAVSGLPVRLALKVTIDDGRVHLDFTGTDPQVAAAMNVPSHGKPHAWLTLRVLALINTLDATAPLNAGLLRHVSITAPKGSLVNPEHPAAVGVRHAAAIRVNDLLNGAFGLALPEVMPAASGGVVVPLVVAEANEQGSQNVQVVEPMIGGTGARYGADGVDGRDSGISNLANNPVETVEAEISIEILRYALRPDSGGPGQWRGGCGLELSFRVLKDGSMVLGRGMERSKFRPWGIRGGRPGASTELVLNEGTPDEKRFGKIDVLRVNCGDVVTLRTAGAGGYGDPFAREPARVLLDVTRDLVSIEAAERDYGVVIREGSVVEAETLARRNGQALANMPHTYGPERETFEQLFTPDLLSRLNRALFRLPAARRTQKRTEIYTAVLQSLPPSFPVGSDAESVTATQRECLLVEIRQLEDHLDIGEKRKAG
jgi:N-methylhydantoinase B